METVNPFERLLHLKKQYETQKEIFQTVGILKPHTDGTLGITDIQGTEWPFPSYREIITHMREKQDTLKKKIDQGFPRSVLFPLV